MSSCRATNAKGKREFIVEDLADLEGVAREREEVARLAKRWGIERCTGGSWVRVEGEWDRYSDAVRAAVGVEGETRVVRLDLETLEAEYNAWRLASRSWRWCLGSIKIGGDR